MKKITRIFRKKRAVSPVIAIILLIGLAVAASAAIFLVVLPLLEPKSNLELNEAFVLYDDTYTQAADEGEGYGKGTIALRNTGTGTIEIISIKVYYAESITSSTNWTEITTAVSLQDISSNNPFLIETLTTSEELTVRFPIPTENDDNTIYYRIVVETEAGTKIDTSKETGIDEQDMQLSADRPNISFTGSLGLIRRTQTISPNSVSDNSAIKNVTYEVASDTNFINIEQSQTITSSLWRWQWNTLNDTASGLDNGTYYMRMTVYDYAGLSRTAVAGEFSIDNDYINPAISNIVGSSIKNGQDIAEVGESFSVSATITDSGSAISAVKEAFIYYKLNDSSTTYSSISMSKGTGDTWAGNIPASFIDSNALENNLTYYINAEDNDENPITSLNKEAGVIDTTQPDITSHTPITQIDQTSLTEKPTIQISVTVVDKDIVDLVTLVWREGNDTGILIPDSWQVETFISQIGDTWQFSIPKGNITTDGIDYYINASDPSGNTNDGSMGSPYHIQVNDQASPDVRFNPVIASPATPGQDVTVRVTVDDNDPSFSTEQFITETGSVKVSYKIGAGSWSIPFDSSHTSGDSSLRPPQDGVWEGIIKGGNFSSLTTVFIRAEALDVSGQSTTIETSVSVAQAGTPIFKYVEETMSVTGASSHILSFDIKNYASGDTAANAVINNITVELSDNTKGSYIGNPLITQIDAGGTGIGGTNPRWTNVSSPSEGTSGNEIILTNTISIDIGETATITLIYANSTGGINFSVNDMTVRVTLGYDYASGTSSDYSDPDLATFNTTITAYQTITETRYMRSDSQLGTIQSAGFLTLNERSSRWSGSLSVTWYMEVWIRSGTLTQISAGESAPVIRSFDGNGLQSATWGAPDYDLNPTDTIVIRVYMKIGSTIYGPIEFETEALGAEDLVASTWTVWYYTERDYDDRVSQLRTRGIFYWGDTLYNSRIENIKYSSLPSGTPITSMILSDPTTLRPIDQQSILQIDLKPIVHWRNMLKITPLTKPEDTNH